MLDKLNYGDIVTIGDYDGHYFRIVEKQTHIYEKENEPDEYEYMVELQCVHTDIPHIAYVDEIEVVATKVEAEAFLADKPAPETYGGGLALMFMPWQERVNTPGPPLTPKSRVTLARERQERIDALLDERNNVGASDDFITVADMEAYRQRRYDEIDAQMKELTANE